VYQKRLRLSPEPCAVPRRAICGRIPRVRSACILAPTTGMRQGELFGLRWADVDLTAGVLHLVRRLKTRSGGVPGAV
jgi:integrase